MAEKATDWQDLADELDAWRRVGRKATFWWRDDDAVAPSRALERLLSLRQDLDVPLAIAVIPEGAEEALGEHLDPVDGVTVMQHGIAHRNQAGANNKKCEFPADRPRASMLKALAAGRERLAELFPATFRPVLVPPWNRIDAGVLADLPSVGLNGLSTFRPRAAVEAALGLRQINCHVDIIDWRGTRGFIGVGAALDQALAHLRARRTAQVDTDEPTGLLTHHLDHDDGCWSFIGEFVRATGDHPAVRWLRGEEALWPSR